MWNTVALILQSLLRILPTVFAELQRIRCQNCDIDEYEYVLMRVEKNLPAKAGKNGQAAGQ